MGSPARAWEMIFPSPQKLSVLFDWQKEISVPFPCCVFVLESYLCPLMFSSTHRSDITFFFKGCI